MFSTLEFADWLERSHGCGRECPAIYKPGLKDAHDKDPESSMANVTVEGSTSWRFRCRCGRWWRARSATG
eukprot:556556-Prymnesium_polylepis.1